jgi:hypothetical protein
LAWGKLFPGGAKDTVQLLKLSVEYGLERVLAVKEALTAGITPTIDLVRRELEPPVTVQLDTAKDIPVSTVDLADYDRKYLAVAP